MGINIKKLIGFIFLIHAGYSLMSYRKYLTFNNRQEEFGIPLDITLEILFGLYCNIFLGILLDKPFEDIYQFTQQRSYEASFARPNFKNYELSRGQVLIPFLKQKLSNFDFK